jgi:hypothetical protein
VRVAEWWSSIAGALALVAGQPGAAESDRVWGSQGPIVAMTVETKPVTMGP